MKKLKSVFMALVIMVVFVLTSCSKDQLSVITVYLPNSYSWLEKSHVCDDFIKEHKCQIKFIYFEASVDMISRLQLERINPRADVIMGLSRATFVKAKDMDLLEKYKPVNADKLKNNNEISSDFYATDFDYGDLAIIYNKEKIKGKLKTFEDLTKLKRTIVLSDPRTSTTGQDFLLWTIAAHKNNWQKYWYKLKPAILTVTSGWSTAFAKLETGEAGAMISYASDKAYNIYKYKEAKFDVFIPESGGFRQLEGNALIKKAQIKDISKEFINYMLDDKVQSKIFLNNWMMPVTDVKLPEVAKYYKQANKHYSVSNKDIQENLESWLRQWTKIITQ